MRIALLGYGKMGQTIAKLAIERNHEIAVIIDPLNGEEFSQQSTDDIDVAIEFTRPEAAFQNIRNCIRWNVPVVSGTTGWLDRLDEIDQELKDHPDASFFYSSNYSLGVNVFFEINRRLAQLMNPLDQYTVKMEEIHHTQKLDAPSGTAITLAEGILENINRMKSWKNDASDNPSDLEIISKRIDAVPGTHTIQYTSEIDDIEITHTAHSRKGFALGAILAAEYIVDKKGRHSMQDLLNL